MMDLFPNKIAVISQPGVVLMPQGFIPLHLKDEDSMMTVERAFRNDRFIGVVQPKADGSLYSSGCLGRITTFNESGDGMFLILAGMIRFRLVRELRKQYGYRRVEVDYAPYLEDFELTENASMDRERLLRAIKGFMESRDLPGDWEELAFAPNDRLVTAVAMSAPFSPEEKQAILELPTVTEQCTMTSALIEMATLNAKPQGAYH